MSGRREPAVRVAVGGLPYFGRRMAALLAGSASDRGDAAGWQARYLETRGWRPDGAVGAVWATLRADVLYQVGGQIERYSRPDTLLALTRRPCVMHWTGSDVTHARGVAARHRVSERLRRGCVHLAGAPWLVEELAAIGVTARWLPHSAVAAPETLPPFPARFTVLAYLRAGREAFYGAGAIRAAAAAVPTAELLVVGVDRLDGAPPNVRCLGWVEDMAPLYARTHALLRLTAHDGLAFMVQEALVHGRYAVWNHPFPGAMVAADHEEAVARLRELAARHTAGCLPLNEAGAAYVRARYHPQRIRDDLRACLAAVARGRQER